ncbi:MAG: hypothetical protein A2937_02765 [Candidatus Yonathbacteria bacterium RIFCSPLOWO2_01_FULL_47_33b]|uniref:Uncharacterized protein n=1 Tax=Candidatus Yonathbacteria bacterium RIFCSPLOWO2_01_FULL_47_33b TaxID=1802727 RepID=A0A1G2SGC5_9BACT|nr:MAG: hypothetical protein A2937_02765 [Candidatus Yonathbacteria bacterium RIFCSPLOWO2_01_FULL_47_33b]
MPNIIPSPEWLQIVSFVVNVIFITYEFSVFIKERKHKQELANIFNSEYRATRSLATSTKDVNIKLQIEHLAEFLKAVTRNLTGRRYDEVGGDHHNFLVRWLENIFDKSRREPRSEIPRNKKAD